MQMEDYEGDESERETVLYKHFEGKHQQSLRVSSSGELLRWRRAFF